MVRCLAFVVVSLLAVRAADAGELNSAALRGSRVDEVGPSYPVFERQPIYRDPRGYDIVPPSYGSATTVQPVPVAALPGYSFEVGARYWYSSGKLAKDLFDDPRFSDVLNSRLTYDGLTAHAFEAFGRIDLPSGLFLKGFAGIAGLSKAIALDMNKFGIRSNAVAPFAWTRMVSSIPDESPEQKRRVEGLKKLVPEKIAPFVVALCSDAARHVTGQIFGVRNNEIYLFSQPRPIRTAHTADGWTPETILDRVLPMFANDFYPLHRSGDVFTWDPV